MPIAQMPCDPHQFAVVMSMNFQQRLRPRPHPNDAALFQHQAVTVAQPYRLREVNQQIGTSFRGQHDPAAMAAIEVDQHLIGRIRPGARRQNGGCADQNRKYRCAIGSTVAGSQVSSTPSARTS